ncbi:MAG: extracellular solute-binding protein [Planctomycetia bacterium]|nr:extracellular solute-binding protein [Planctomycetia bacterium]
MKPWFAIVGLAALAGCTNSAGDSNEVVVYTSLDSVFSESILDEFTNTAGLTALAKFDTESTKSVGLAQAIIAEQAAPRCDVFWNNEILNTLRLEEQGLLEVYRSPSAESYPEMWRSPNGTWHGFAARARVLIVNADLAPEGDRPTSYRDLADAKWKGRVGIAKPLFGTTATHAACLFALLGDEEAKQYFRDLKANDVQIMAGNKHVAQAVAAGQLAFGFTDTDDAISELEAGQPVAIVYPDREPDQLGTLFIPNTLAIIKNCPHPENARRLVDYLLAPDIEAKLAESHSAQIPLNPAVTTKPRVETPRTVKAMPVDFAAAVKQWDNAATFIRDEFATAE